MKFKKSKYSENKIRDIKWYLSVRHKLNFNPKNSNKTIVYEKNGINWLDCYIHYDETGEMLPTKHPLTVKTLLKVKSGANFQIKEWAEGMARFYSTPFEIKNWCCELNSPDWFFISIANQCRKITFHMYYFGNEIEKDLVKFRYFYFLNNEDIRFL